MALDQSSDSNKTPIVNVPEEPLIITSSNPPLQPFFVPSPGPGLNPGPGMGLGPVRFDVSSNPPMMPVSGYGYPNVGFVNPNMVWAPRVDPHPPPPTSTGSGFVRGAPNLGTSVSGGGGVGIDQGDPTGGGFVRSPNVGLSVSGGGGSVSAGIDRGSEEGGGGDDSVSGKKVKFMCSFGGKILPRPSDGLLRYVGGQTRIISVRRDVTFGELVRKMMDAYGQPVLIKYQLPDEDLDALVSVSCPDDVDNMMEEYEKLIERSPDGSAKLRVFLFSGPDVDGLGFGGGGSNDGGQRYLDAVNGVGEGVVGGGITRKESIASFASTQNSDVSGSEVFETLVGQEVSGPPSSSMFSPRSDSAASYDNTPRVEISAPPVVFPAGMSSHPASSQLEIEPERVPILAYGQQQPPQWGYDLQQPGMNIQPRASPYVGSYMDPHQDVLNRGASQMVYTNPQVLGAPRPMLVHPQYRDGPPNLLNQQFLPAVQMTMAPTSTHMSMNPNIPQPVVQPSHRIVTVPTESGHSNAFQTPVGGGYGWPQAPSQDHVTFSEGYMPHQQVVITTPDCYMCQKALPHAHSDSIVQDQRVSQPPNVSGTNPIHQSLRIEDVSKFYAPQNQVGLVTDAQNYGGVRGNVPVSALEDTIQPHFVASSQLQNEPPVSKPGNSDNVGGVAYHAQEQFIPEISHVPAMIYRDDGARPAIPNDFVTPRDFKMENLPADNLSGNEQGKFPIDQLRKDDMFEHMTPQTMGREVLPNAETGSLHSNVLPATSPHNWGAVGNDTANSLFSNQDPWNMRHETHFPPPKPSKIGTKGEAFTIDNHLNGGQQNIDANFADSLSTTEQVQAGKGSAEERIKEQLQATAEGVAASVLHSSVPSNDYSDTNISEENHEIEGQTNSDAVIQTKMEAMNIKSDKANFGLPLSDGLGRLQIIKNSDLEELQELGSGTFGTVYHGKWRGTDVAIKRINDRCFAGKPSEEERMRNDFWNEAINLADLHHPNVVAFYGVVLDGPGGFVATVTEYMVNGSLRTALQKKERNLDKRKRLLIAMDVAFGMEYLHSKNIVHFDLKSDNLLVNLRDPHRPICKVGDLGLSKVKCQTLISGGVRGTLPWMAPELLNGSSSRVSEKVDVFSFGVVMWELLTGEEPYADLHYGAIIGGIVSNTLRPSIPENCDPEWRSLMERCWAAEPTERPTFTKVADELRCMASKIPVKNQTSATTTRTNS